MLMLNQEVGGRLIYQSDFKAVGEEGVDAAGGDRKGDGPLVVEIGEQKQRFRR